MFEAQTLEVIRQRMLDQIDESLDKREGSVVYDLISPSAFEMANFFGLMDEVIKIAFAPTSYGEFLDMRASELGIYRKKGTYAIGEVTFTGDPEVDEGKLIPEGTVVSTGGDTPIYFLTTKEAVMSGGSVNVPVQCEIPGLFGNVRAGAVNVLLGDLENLYFVSNTEDFYAGSDDESDADLLSRYNDLVQRPTTSGNENHYLAWAKSVSGIGDARVRSNNSDSSVPVGNVEVYLLDNAKQPASPALIQFAADYISTVRPVGANVVCQAATGVPINVSVELITEQGADLASIHEQINQGISDYLQSLAFRQDIVRCSRISNIFLDIEGVLDYDNFLVNGGTSNITTSYTEVAVKGEVTFV